MTTKKVKSKHAKSAVTQKNSHSSIQLSQVKQKLKTHGSTTFSLTLSQFYELAIAEEYEQALEANSLEKIEFLLDKVLKLRKGS